MDGSGNVETKKQIKSTPSPKWALHLPEAPTIRHSPRSLPFWVPVIGKDNPEQQLLSLVLILLMLSAQCWPSAPTQ